MLAAPPGIRLGLDFDNTIVQYDGVFQSLSVESGLLPSGFTGGKRAARDQIRALPDGEARWTSLQARVYGTEIARATPSPHLLDFLARCRAAGIEVSIVSHKTEHAVADPGGVNLREAARGWIASHGLTDPVRGGIPPERVFFESTREEKIARIQALGCTHFVDDLDEVFLEPSFPARTRAYLYHPAGGTPPAGPWLAVRDWRQIADDLLGPLAS